MLTASELYSMGYPSCEAADAWGVPGVPRGERDRNEIDGEIKAMFIADVQAGRDYPLIVAPTSIHSR